jgi:hypothetical protein
VRFGHDPGKNDQKKKKKDGPEKNGFASEELDVFIIRPFDIHSSYPVYMDSATQCSCRITGARVANTSLLSMPANSFFPLTQD